MLERGTIAVREPMKYLRTIGAAVAIAILVAGGCSSGDKAVNGVCKREYDSILRAMNRILNDMKKLESFTEILSRLKELIRIQNLANTQTKKERDKELEKVFGPENKTPPVNKGKDGK